MKKYYQIIGGLFFLGLLICGIGYFNRGFQTIGTNNGQGPLVVLKNNPRRIRRTLTTTKKFTTADITIKNTQLVVKPGPQLKAEFTSKQYVQVVVRDHQLQIIQKQYPNQVNEVHLQAPQDRSPVQYSRLVITIPPKQTLAALKIKADNCRLFFQNVAVNKLVLDNTNSQADWHQVSIIRQAQINDSDCRYQLDNCLLAAPKLDLNDAHLQIQHSQLTNLDLNANTINLKILATALGQDNLIKANDLQLTLEDLNPDLSINTSGHLDIIHNHQPKRRQLQQNNSSINFLDIHSDDGQLKLQGG